jgi:hypothetical protein
MELKNTREDIIRDIEQRVRSEVSSGLSNLDYVQMSNIKNEIPNIIGKAVSAAFSEFLHNLYTHRDFEKDIGLDT